MFSADAHSRPRGLLNPQTPPRAVIPDDRSCTRASLTSSLSLLPRGLGIAILGQWQTEEEAIPQKAKIDPRIKCTNCTLGAESGMEKLVSKQEFHATTGIAST